MVLCSCKWAGVQYLLWVTVRYWEVTGSEVYSESLERWAWDPPPKPKSLSSLTIVMFDLSQCKHCVCMSWREKEKDGQTGCLASAKETLLLSPQHPELHIHTPQNTNTEWRMGVGWGGGGEFLSSHTLPDVQCAVSMVCGFDTHCRKNRGSFYCNEYYMFNITLKSA